MDFIVGQVVNTKKPHPCGSTSWVILRVGADFKIKCTVCGRICMLTRQKFEKSIQLAKKVKNSPTREV